MKPFFTFFIFSIFIFGNATNVYAGKCDMFNWESTRDVCKNIVNNQYDQTDDSRCRYNERCRCKNKTSCCEVMIKNSIEGNAGKEKRCRTYELCGESDGGTAADCR